MEEISITRALAELKLLDSKINKKISESDFVYHISKKQKNINTQLLSKMSQSNYQSITDLIQRRRRMKSAIILSNAITKVKLREQEMTVAEVIESKSLVDYYVQLLDKMRSNRENIMNTVERQNQSMENELQKILEINFGKSNNLKTNADDIESISKTYREHNRSEMLDPISIDEKITEVEEICNDYMTESNFVLSESNAITKIKI